MPRIVVDTTIREKIISDGENKPQVYGGTQAFFNFPFSRVFLVLFFFIVLCSVFEFRMGGLRIEDDCVCWDWNFDFGCLM